MIKVAAIRSQSLRNYCSIVWCAGPSGARLYTVLSAWERVTLTGSENIQHAQAEIDGAQTLKAVGKKRPIVPAMIVCMLIGATSIGIWQLRPKQTPDGRPIGEVGKIQAFATPSANNGEGLAVWRDGRKTYELPASQAATIERIELSSIDVDIAGSLDPDMVLYTWSGGAHCCFSQILIDGRTGKKLGQFDIGNGDPTPFIPSKAKNLARAVALNIDDVSAFKFGSYADSPMARILVVWDGTRFSLDTKRMKAASPDGPPAFFVSEPELADAVSIGVQDFGENEDKPALVEAAVNRRGDRAKAYQAWMEGEEARMISAELNPNDVASYGPMAAFLNERIYKGQGKAGVATVLDVYKADAERAQVALSFYFSMLHQSRWFEDLDRLNGGELTRVSLTYR